MAWDLVAHWRGVWGSAAGQWGCGRMDLRGTSPVETWRGSWSCCPLWLQHHRPGGHRVAPRCAGKSGWWAGCCRVRQIEMIGTASSLGCSALNGLKMGQKLTKGTRPVDDRPEIISKQTCTKGTCWSRLESRLHQLISWWFCRREGW